MLDFSRRIHTPEIMDDVSRPQAEFVRAYKELTLINQYLGGTRAVERFMPAVKGTAWLLDIAAGACDIGEAVGRSGSWNVVALDHTAEGLGTVRESVPVMGDAFGLPFKEDTFDLVVASLFFHHLPDSDCVRLLKEMYRVARRMVIVNDLHRTRIAYSSILVLTRIFSRSPMVRNDGPLSVRRGFRPAELANIAKRAGLRAEVHRSFPYRLVMVVDK